MRFFAIRSVQMLALTLVLLAGSFSFNPSSAATRVVVSGEDSNRHSVRRDMEIYISVIAQLQESLSRAGFDVIDEDLLAVEAGFRIANRRPKTELIETLKVANEDGNVKIKSRLAVIFSIIPQVKKLSMASRIESIRIRGDIYDLASLKKLSTFKVKSIHKKVLPPDCDFLCVSEQIIDIADDLAMDLGDTLVQKLEMAVEEIGGGSSCGTLCDDGKSGAANASMSRPLLFELVRFEYPVVRKFMKIMGRQKGISKIEMGSSSGTKRSYSMETTLDTGVLEEKIYDALEAASVNYENVKIKITPDSVRVQNLNR
jgi:hypothetical protein